MKVLGLTGSIGMGKSTVATMLAREGVPVHDSDQSARDALSPSSPIFDAVIKIFPEAYSKKQKVIDRKKLGDIVFNDPEKKAVLESYVHPFVQAKQHQFIKSQQQLGRQIVALDIPLLFETGADQRVDVVIVVTAPFFIQSQRVLARPNMTVDKFNAILCGQMPDIQKQSLADYVVQTGLGRSRTHRQIKQILKGLSS